MRERCPAATLCLDPYHVVALATQALDQVRREVWQQARRAGDTTGARWLKGARWALWKRPERLTDRQQAKLATIEHVNRRLYRAYLLKEQLRLVFHSTPDEAIELLEAWLAWARRCRIGSFVKLAKTITLNKAGIVATLTHRLSNARIEAINTTLRLICRRAYGFHSAEALICARDAHRRRPPASAPRPRMNPGNVRTAQIRMAKRMVRPKQVSLYVLRTDNISRVPDGCISLGTRGAAGTAPTRLECSNGRFAGKTCSRVIARGRQYSVERWSSGHLSRIRPVRSPTASGCHRSCGAERRGRQI